MFAAPVTNHSCRNMIPFSESKPLRLVAHGFVNPLPTCLVLPGHFRIHLALLRVELRLQLAIALEPFERKGALVDGCPDRASRFALVSAVPKLAALGQGCDVCKRALCTFLMVPELKFAHSRRVDQDTATGKKKHLTRGGSVPSAVILFAHRLDLQPCIGEPVYDR